MSENRLRPIWLSIVAVASLSACGGGGSTSDPSAGVPSAPSPTPVPVPAPAPAPAPAVATLRWAAVSDADVAGYRIYYGTSPGSYVQAQGAGLDAGNTTTFMLNGLVSRTTYYIAVSAYDAARNESALSAEVSKQVQ